MPDTGSHFKVMENRLIMIKASQNSGAENPINAVTLVALSIMDPLLTAEKTPRGIPIAIIKIIDEMFIKRVIGMRSAIFCETGLLSTYDLPKSKNAIRRSQSKYCK